MFKNLAALPDSFFAREGTRLSLVAYLFLLMLCFAFFTPGLVTIPPTDRDESSFAQASKQMIETGNYTDIRLQDVPRYKKPIGIYWLQSAAVRALNPQNLDEIWAYRVPSFVGATVAVLMTAALGALLFTPATGLLAAIMLAGCCLLNAEARLATTDAVLLGCVTVAMYALARVRGLWAGRFIAPFLFWTALALGILVKGPIILLPIGGVLLWLKLSDKNLAWFRALRPALGIPYALALVAPWFIAISLQSHGDFVTQSAGHDMLAKLWQGQNRGIMPPGLYLLAMPLTFFPFALFVFFAVPDAWKNRQDAAVKFCLGWILPTWIVFELSLTKLPHYVLPVYPALALLAAKFLLDGFPTVAETARLLPVALAVSLWLMLGVGFATVFALLPVFSDNHWSGLQIAAGMILMLSQGIALFLLPRQRIASLVALTIGSLIFMTVTFGNTLPQLQKIWLSREIVEAVEPIKPCPQTQIVSVGYHEPSLVFLAGTKTLFLTNGGDVAVALRQDVCRVAVVAAKHKQEFLDSFVEIPQQPHEAGAIKGLNSGHGAQLELTLYTLP